MRYAALVLLAFLATSAAASRDCVFAQQPEKTHVELGVGGKSLIVYLPLVIAERRGYFKEEGLDVNINDFSGGSQSLQALIGKSVDIVAGSYDHVLPMQTKGQDIRALLGFASAVNSGE